MIHFEKLQPKPIFSPILKYALMIFIIRLADGIMSYIVPVHVEHALNSAFLMGIVISSSSFFGLIFDLWIDKYMWDKTYRFFVKMLFISAIGFPLVFIFFPDYIWVFLIAMSLWSLYYEFMGYSTYGFVHKFLKKEDHTYAWSLLSAFASMAYLIAPILCIYLLEGQNPGSNTPFYFALGIYIVGIIFYGLFLNNYKDRHKPIQDITHPQRNVTKEFKMLFVLFRKIWLLFVFGIIIQMVDSFFWTIGTLWSEELRQVNHLGGLLLSAYSLPTIFAGLIATKVHLVRGKKRAAFVTAIIAGLILVFIGQTTSVNNILISVVVMSLLYSLTMIFYCAVEEDYIARLNNFGNDMITLSQMAGNLGYVIGPITAGYIASRVGNQQSFMIMGIIVVITGIISLIAIPKRIAMPQVELKRLTD